MEPLWPYQIRAKEKLRENMRPPLRIRRQILCAPTGSGKTHIAMSIMQDAAAKGSTVVFVADREVLVNQTSQKCFANGINHGVAMADKTFGRSEKIQVASAQTLERRNFVLSGPIDEESGQHMARKINLMIIDECHDRREGIWSMARKADYVIGLSATPLRQGLGELYEKVVNCESTNRLIKDGYLSPLKVVVPVASQIDLEGLKSSGKEWDKTALGQRTRMIVGDIVPEWERQTTKHFGGPVKTIVFCASVADTINTAENFQMAGHDFRVVHSKQSSEMNDTIIEDFSYNRFIGLVNCDMLSRGFDDSSIMCMVDASPLRKSLMKHLQKIGRIMRIDKESGKEFALLIDHADNYRSFDYATQMFWTSGVTDLNDDTLRKSKRVEDKAELEEMSCHECGFVFGTTKPDACPVCGAAAKRKLGLMVSMPGILEHIDDVDGSVGVFEGSNRDWWLEVCAYCVRRHPKNMKQAHREAKGIWYGLNGQGCKWYKFIEDRDDPHPTVKEILDRRRRHFFASKQHLKYRKIKRVSS